MNARLMLKITGVVVGLMLLFLVSSFSQAESKGTIEYWSVGVTVPETWKLFEEEYKQKIHFVENAHDAGLVITKLIAGNAQQIYDILNMNSWIQRELVPENQLAPVDPTRIPNLKFMYKWWPLDNPMFQWDGKQYGLPILANGDSFAYWPEVTQILGHEPDSYGVLFDERFKGRVAIQNRSSIGMQKTAMYLKEAGLAKIKDPANLTNEELKVVADFLIEKKKAGQFRCLWQGFQDAVNLLVNKEVLIIDCWEPICIAAQKAGKPVKYAWPKEGFMLWANANWLIKDAAVKRGKEQAIYDLVNWQWDGYYCAWMAQHHGYATATPLGEWYAAQHPDEFDVDFIKSIQERVRKKFEVYGGYYENMRPVNMREYQRQWQRFLSA